MSDDSAVPHDTLTPEQLATIERARNTPYVISRSRRRPPGKKEWTFKPFIEVNPDVDFVELLHRERERMYARAIPKRSETSSQ